MEVVVELHVVAVTSVAEQLEHQAETVEDTAEEASLEEHVEDNEDAEATSREGINREGFSG